MIQSISTVNSVNVNIVFFTVAVGKPDPVRPVKLFHHVGTGVAHLNQVANFNFFFVFHCSKRLFDVGGHCKNYLLLVGAIDSGDYVVGVRQLFATVEFGTNKSPLLASASLAFDLFALQRSGGTKGLVEFAVAATELPGGCSFDLHFVFHCAYSLVAFGVNCKNYFQSQSDLCWSCRHTRIVRVFIQRPVTWLKVGRPSQP